MALDIQLLDPYEPDMSSTDGAELEVGDDRVPSPSQSSTDASPVLRDDMPDSLCASAKKKKKRKPKKSAKAKDAANAVTANGKTGYHEGRVPVLCISRNKHWRYISSYHGPWLQLPLELLESLTLLNLDPATLLSVDTQLPPLPSPSLTGGSRPRERGFLGLGDHSPPESPHDSFRSLPPPPAFPQPKPGHAAPPPIDPGVLKNVILIRKLIDEASELTMRASSGLSAVALGSMRGGSVGLNSNSPWTATTSLGLNPMGDNNGGRSAPMSALRIHRLRALAVQKLAQAYRTDEIASSVMVMQGGSVLDDLAERVLKQDPNDLDAKYVHFFHEKIPSRQLAESTTTAVLDELLVAHPEYLEIYRTRGIVRCFRDEYEQATRDFTTALKEVRAVRKARIAQRYTCPQVEFKKPGKKKKGNRSNGQAPPSGTSVPLEPTSVEGPDGESILIHPSASPDAPDPLEPQLLFLRGAAHMQHAVFLIEEAILKLEGILKCPSADGAELRLCYLENGRYGGVEIGNPDGPLGKTGGAKQAAYEGVLRNPELHEQVLNLLKKASRDHEKFLSHFDTLEEDDPTFEGNLAQQTESAFRLSESIRPGTQSVPPSLAEAPMMFTTYHPLLVESHFSILICQMMLSHFETLLPTFIRTAAIVDGLDGYPVFLPPRSMAQAEFIEVLERLAGGWSVGVQPHSLSSRTSGKLAIGAPPTPSRMHVDRHPVSSRTSSYDGSSTCAAAASGSSTQYATDYNPSADGHSSHGNKAGQLFRALDTMRILLAPVLKRRHERSEKSEKGTKKKPLNINIPLHGPRVEIILAWLGAIVLPGLESAA